MQFSFLDRDSRNWRLRWCFVFNEWKNKRDENWDSQNRGGEIKKMEGRERWEGGEIKKNEKRGGHNDTSLPNKENKIWKV